MIGISKPGSCQNFAIFVPANCQLHTCFLLVLLFPGYQGKAVGHHEWQRGQRFIAFSGWLPNRLNGFGARLMSGKTALARLAITDHFRLFAGYLLAFYQQITGIDLA